MTKLISIDEMFTPLWTAAPSFGEWFVSHSSPPNQQVQIGPYEILSELACYLVDRLANFDTDGFETIFQLVEDWHVNGDKDVQTAATLGLLEDLQDRALHDGTVPELFFPWLFPATKLAWQELELFWAGGEANQTD